MQRQQIEVSEQLFGTYIPLLSLPPPDPFAHDSLEYHIPYRGHNRIIKILETPRIISGLGTTGKRTWAAALHLVEYIIDIDGSVANDILNRNVLELGAGTGFVGTFISKCLDPAKVLLTDGSLQVVDSLKANLQLNDIHINDSVQCQQLLWGETEIEQGILNATDYVFAADVTYDKSVLPALISCLHQFLHSNPNCKIYISATIRNEDTINCFEHTCKNAGLSLEVVNTFVPNVDDEDYNKKWAFYHKGTPEIRIYKIS